MKNTNNHKMVKTQKTLIAIACFTVVFVILSLISFNACSKRFYWAAGSVVEYDNELLYETEDGNLWELAREDERKGESIKLLMYDNNTDTIEDDKIVIVR